MAVVGGVGFAPIQRTLGSSFTLLGALQLVERGARRIKYVLFHFILLVECLC